MSAGKRVLARQGLAVGLVLFASGFGVLALVPAGAAELDVALVDQFAAKTAAPGDTATAFLALLGQLRAAEADTPGLALGDLAGEMSADGFIAQRDLGKALADLKTSSEGDTLEADSAKVILPELMTSMVELARSGPQNPMGLYALGLAIDEAKGAGLTKADIIGAVPEAADVTTFNAAIAAQQSSPDAATLERSGATLVKIFLDHLVGLLPETLAPGLSAPTSVFFGDLMKWNHDMWSSSTDALSLVSDAIQTGKFDQAAYDKLAKRLQTLGQQGPWTTQSGIDFGKKMSELLPSVGKLLKALWSGLGQPASGDKDQVAKASLPPGKYSGGLTIHNLSACEEFSFSSLNSPPGDSGTGAFLTVTSGDATLVLEEEGSTKAADYFQTSDGTLALSPEHIVGGIRRKSLYYFDMTLTKAADAGGYTAEGTLIIQDACEGNAPTYQATLTFAPVTPAP